jgi:voltage-gated potassium channel
MGSERRRIYYGIALFGLIVVVATIWYWVVESFSPVNALYQTVITVATVGFGEIEPLDTSGRIFTIFVILIGVGAGLYAFSGLFELVVTRQSGRLGRRRLEHQIQKLNGHAIIAGYGRIGSKVADLLRDEMDVVIVDERDDRVAEAREDGFIAVKGDAADDEVLSAIYLENANILIAALPTDADNLYVVLTGRTMNEELHIVSRAQYPSSGAKLMKAGADRVVNPEDIGAHRLAAFALRPAVSEFMDVVMHGASIEYRLEEVSVDEGSDLSGKTLADADIRARTGAIVLAIRLPGKEFSTNPPDDVLLLPGTTMIAFGTRDELDALASV